MKVKTLKDFRDLAEKDFILAKLEAIDWNISQTARGNPPPTNLPATIDVPASERARLPLPERRE